MYNVNQVLGLLTHRPIGWVNFPRKSRVSFNYKSTATLVAGYKAWQKKFERHVNKGEKAIRILAPAPYKIKEERDKLDPVTGEMMFDENGMPQKEQVEVTIPAFRAVSVFDVNDKFLLMLSCILKPLSFYVF